MIKKNNVIRPILTFRRVMTMHSYLHFELLMYNPDLKSNYLQHRFHRWDANFLQMMHQLWVWTACLTQSTYTKIVIFRYYSVDHKLILFGKIKKYG